MATAPLTLTVQVPELTRKLHDAVLAVLALADGTETVATNDLLSAIGQVSYDQPQPSVPVEYEWGTSPYVSGIFVQKTSNEDVAVWLRERRGVHVYRRPVPTEWELVQP